MSEFRERRLLTFWSMQLVLKRVINKHKDAMRSIWVRTRCFCGDPLEDIVHKGVEDSHSLVGDTGIGMDLLED
jgi:hypothetical protein